MKIGICSLIDNERKKQDRIHGKIEDHPHSVAEWMLIMRKELQEAENAWIKRGEVSSIMEIIQVIAVGVACLEQHMNFTDLEKLETKTFSYGGHTNSVSREKYLNDKTKIKYAYADLVEKYATIRGTTNPTNVLIKEISSAIRNGYVKSGLNAIAYEADI